MLATVLVMAAGCGTATPSDSESDGAVSVVAAFYPLVFAVAGVGGSLVDVDNLTAPGVEPHDLELSADQVRTVSEADLVVFLGQGFQPAVDDVVSGLEGERVLDLLHEDRSDPHVWLDPSLMAEIVDTVAARLSAIDPPNEATYVDNAAEMITSLDALDTELREGLASCRTRDIVTSHAAFGYLASRYELHQVSISGLDPESEPSPARMADVARFVHEHEVSTIFFEELVSPEVA